MTRQEALVYIQGQVVSAQIELAHMLAANAERVAVGEKPTYTSIDILNLQNSYCIGHNSVLSLIKESN